ncbi:transposase [Sphingobium olei]
MSRYHLIDFEWRTIEPLLPNKPRGVPRFDDRRVLNGIFWVDFAWSAFPPKIGQAAVRAGRPEPGGRTAIEGWIPA